MPDPQDLTSQIGTTQPISLEDLLSDPLAAIQQPTPSPLDAILPSRQRDMQYEQELRDAERRIRERIMLTPSQRAQEIIQKHEGWKNGVPPGTPRKALNLVENILEVARKRPTYQDLAEKRGLEEYKAEAAGMGRDESVIAANQRAQAAMQSREAIARQLDDTNRKKQLITLQSNIMNQKIKEGNLEVAQAHQKSFEEYNAGRITLDQLKGRLAEAETKYKDKQTDILGTPQTGDLAAAFKKVRSQDKYKGVDPTNLDDPLAGPMYQEVQDELMRMQKNKPASTSYSPTQIYGPNEKLLNFDRRTGQYTEADTRGLPPPATEVPNAPERRVVTRQQLDSIHSAEQSMSQVYQEVVRALAHPEAVGGLKNALSPNLRSFFNISDPNSQDIFIRNKLDQFRQLRGALPGQRYNVLEFKLIQELKPQTWTKIEDFTNGDLTLLEGLMESTARQRYHLPATFTLDPEIDRIRQRLQQTKDMRTFKMPTYEQILESAFTREFRGQK